MKKERTMSKVSALATNDGQLGWLPKNPRQWSQADVDRTSRSIAKDTDFLEDRPILAVPFGKSLIVFAGNLRYTAARGLHLKEVPVVVYTPENEDDKETIKRRSILDNGSFGSWDFDELANNWDELPLPEWGVPVWKPDTFTPNLNPIDRPDVVTKEDILKAEEILNDEVTPSEKQFMEVVCPHCGKTITIKI